MKVELELETDSYNNYPTEKLIIEFSMESKRVWLSISDKDREVSVSKQELKKVVSLFS